jgi:DNA adenine methylase
MWHSRPIRPLLKWVGGKRQLLPQLRRFYPPEFGRSIEPFVGSGAVFFDLCAAGRLLSNSTAAGIAGLYDTNRETQAAGLRALRGSARRAIDSNRARRGPVDEYVITNIQ